MFSNLRDKAASIGSTNLSAYFFKYDLANSIWSISTKELPIDNPWAFQNVNAIPPPMITLSTFLIKCSIVLILSDTLAPPIIAIAGLGGFVIAFVILVNSSSTKYPIADSLIFDAIPTLDACALCAVPNASLINTSPSEAQNFPNFGLFFDSALPFKSSHLVFSNMMICPGSIFFTASLTSGPVGWGTKVTFFPNNLLNSVATGFKDFLALSASSLILPKCDNRITLAFASNALLIVGKAATILLLLVIFPSLIGTLKSTLIITFLFARSNWSILFLLFIKTPFISKLKFSSYCITFVTEPAPTVLPPSLIENFVPSSIATG